MIKKQLELTSNKNSVKIINVGIDDETIICSIDHPFKDFIGYKLQDAINFYNETDNKIQLIEYIRPNRRTDLYGQGTVQQEMSSLQFSFD